MNDTPSYLLSWLPPYFIEGSRHGYWELMSLSEYDDPGYQANDAWTADLPRDADIADLTRWVETRIGAPVVLSEDKRKVRGARWWNRWHTEPLIYVTVSSSDECAPTPAGVLP